MNYSIVITGMAKKQKSTRREQPPSRNAGKDRAPFLRFNKSALYILLAVSGGYTLLRILVILLSEPGERVWGLDFARYILSWDIWIALALPMVFCFPLVAKWSVKLFRRKHSAPSSVRYYATAIGITAVLLFLANEYQVLYSFLGDGSYCHAEVYRVGVDPEMESQLFDKPTAYGTGQALRFIATSMDLTDYRYPFLLLSWIGIIVLVPGLFFVLRNEPRPVAMLYIMIILGTPAALFFFGYIELYTIQYAFLALFFAAGYSSLRHDAQVYLPLAFLALSAAFGGSSLIYFPSAMFLAAAHRIKASHHPRRAVGGLVVLSLLVFIGLLLLQWDSMQSPYLIPTIAGNITREDGIMTGWFGYSMFSLPHLVDMVNTLLFNGGVVLLLGLTGMAIGGLTAMKESLPIQFGLVAAVAGFLLILGGNASFGLARDWDLAVIPSIGILFFCATILIHLHERGRISLPLLLPVITATSFGTVYIWVALNHAPASAERLEDIIEMDAELVQPIITYTGYENLRKFYTFESREDDRARVLKGMIATGWHIDVLYNEGITQAVFFEDETRRRNELDWYFSHLIERLKENYPESHYRHISQKKLNEMVAGLLLFMQPERPDYTAMYNDMVHDAVPEWPYYEFVAAAVDDSIPMERKYAHTEGVVPLSATDPILLARMGDYYQFGKQYRAAVQYYSRSLEESPHDYPTLYMTVAGIQAGIFGQPDSAIGTLERCIENCRLSPQLPAAKEMLAEIKRRMETQ